jgi:regulator of protease activity HflC (stomatin/prohibitin superfamily)
MGPWTPTITRANIRPRNLRFPLASDRYGTRLNRPVMVRAEVETKPMPDADYIYTVETVIGDDDALRTWARTALPALHDDVPNPTIDQILAAVNDPDTDSVILGNHGNWSVLDFGS